MSVDDGRLSALLHARGHGYRCKGRLEGVDRVDSNHLLSSTRYASVRMLRSGIGLHTITCSQL